MSWRDHPDIRTDVPHDPHEVAELIRAADAAEQAARDELLQRIRAERHGGKS